jgi:hypothetical protein
LVTGKVGEVSGADFGVKVLLPKVYGDGFALPTVCPAGELVGFP